MYGYVQYISTLPLPFFIFLKRALYIIHVARNAERREEAYWCQSYFQQESFIYLSSSGFWIPAFPYACLAQVRAGWYISLTNGPSLMDNWNGLPEWMAKWTNLNCLPWKKKEKRKEKDNQSLVVLIDNSKDSINERFGLQLASERSKKLHH